MTLKVGVVLAAQADDLREWLNEAASYDAAGAHLLWIDKAGDEDPLALATALAALTHRALLVVVTDRDVLATVHKLAGGRLRINSPDETERWVAVPAPESRAAWRESIKQAEENGADGVLVPANNRLLDLLRNPGDPGERHDLELTVG
jgi:hypothetical protein